MACSAFWEGSQLHMSHFGACLVPEFQSARLQIIVYFVNVKSPTTLQDGRAFVRAAPEGWMTPAPPWNLGENVPDVSGGLCL